MRKWIIPAILLLSAGVFAQDDLRGPRGGSGTVTIPLTEYDKLVERASHPPRKAEDPPLPYALSRVDMKLRVVEESVNGTLQFEGEVLRKGITQVPLISGMTVLDARQAGKPLPLAQEGGTRSAVLPGPGSFSVALDTGMPLTIEPGRASFVIPVPAAGSALVSLDIPGDHTGVHIEPGIITRRSSSDGHTVVEASLVPGRASTVWWATRETTQPAVAREVRYLSDIKTLVSAGESDFRLAVLADVTVVQGEPSQFELSIPRGFELTGANGTSLEAAEAGADFLVLKVREPQRRSHQFLVTFEKTVDGNKVEAPILGFKDPQRETGEVLIEGIGTIELTAREEGGLMRMDFRESAPVLRSLARHPLQAAFRFHRRAGQSPRLSLEWNRFPDSQVLAAIAENAVVTTLVTSEGKTLTEVKLTVRNHSQPFLKVGLPQGATLLSAEVEGEKVKPVEGADGSRVPLLRAGFRPSGPYEVSFVFMHSGAPFARKGDSELTLPRMDIPVSVVQWEVFLPERYDVKGFDGNIISAALMPGWQLMGGEENREEEHGSDLARTEYRNLGSGKLGGVVVDAAGGVIPGASVSVEVEGRGIVRTATTDSEGCWTVSGLPAGQAQVKISADGFKHLRTSMLYDSARSDYLHSRLEVGAVAESVSVQGNVPQINAQMIQNGAGLNASQNSNANGSRGRNEVAQQVATGSQNVFALQRRVAGVLPVRVDVPRAGRSHIFVRPLVLDEETRVTFTYRKK